MTPIELKPEEVAQIRYKLWKIQQRVKTDTVVFNWARHIRLLIDKAERRRIREDKKQHQ